MACENRNRYIPIVTKFSGYLPLYEDTSAIDFGPDRSICLAVHGSKVGHNELDCSSVCKKDRTFTGCYRYVLFNNWVLPIPKIGQLSESGTLPEWKMVLVTRYFAILVYVKKKLGVVKLLSVPKMGQMSQSEPECHMGHSTSTHQAVATTPSDFFRMLLK